MGSNSGDDEYIALFTKRNRRETAWLLISGLAAVIVFLVVYANVYESVREGFGPLRCRDGWASASVGTQGACSGHGGVDYSPVTKARWAGLLTAIPVAAAFVVFSAIIETVTSPYNARLRKILRGVGEVSSPIVAQQPVHDPMTCERCGGKLDVHVKKLKNQLPDRRVWYTCSECGRRSEILLE